MNNEELFTLVQEVRNDVKVLKDNHLKHIEADMGEVKTELKVMSLRIDKIEEFTSEIESFIRKYSFRAITIVLSAGGIGALML
jgi:predicted aspartyl protease